VCVPCRGWLVISYYTVFIGIVKGKTLTIPKNFLPNLLLSTLAGLWACLVLPFGYDAPLSECATMCQDRTDFSNDLPRLNLAVGDQSHASAIECVHTSHRSIRWRSNQLNESL